MLVLFFLHSKSKIRGWVSDTNLLIQNKVQGEKMSDLLEYKLVGEGPIKVIILHDW
jgi:hypothetical protein